MKRIISFALALTLAFSSMPYAFAEENIQEPSGDDFIMLNPDQETTVIDSTQETDPEETDPEATPVPTPAPPSTAQQYADLLNGEDGSGETQYYMVRSEEDLRNIWVGDINTSLAKLAENITITQPLNIPANKMANLDLDGHTITIDVSEPGIVFNLLDPDSRKDQNPFPQYQSFGTLTNGNIVVKNADTVFSRDWWNWCNYTIQGSCNYLFESNLVNYEPVNFTEIRDYSASDFTVYKSYDSSNYNTQIYVNKAGGSFTLAENLNANLAQVTYLSLQASAPDVKVYLAYKNATPGVSVNKLGILTTDPVTADLILTDKLSTNFTDLYFDRNLAEYVDHMKGTANSCDTPDAFSIDYTCLSANWKDPFENIEGVHYTSNYSVVLDPLAFEVEYDKEVTLPLTIPETESVVTLFEPESYPEGTQVSVTGENPNYRVTFRLTDYTKPTGSFTIPYEYVSCFYAPSITDGGSVGWDTATDAVRDAVSVTWQLTKLPVLGIEVVEPANKDGQAYIDWGTDPIVWKASLTPEGAVGDISVTSDKPDVITVDGSQLLIKGVGQVTLTFSCEDVSEQLIVSVNATPEYTWVHEVESIQPPITLANQQQLERLETEASGLDMSKIPEETWEKFQGYLQDLEDLLNNSPHLVVERMIERLPEPDKLQFVHAGDVDAAKKAYDALSDEHKGLVKPELVTKLQKCVERIAELREQMQEAQAIIDAIASLPAPEDIQLVHAPTVQEISEDLQAFDEAAGETSPLIPKESRDKLNACIKQIEKIQAAIDTANSWADRVTRLPDPVAITDSNYLTVEPSVIQLRSEYEAFDQLIKTEIQGSHPDALKKLADLEAKIASKYEESYKKEADKFNRTVLAVNLDTVTSEFKPQYDAFIQEYNAMTPEVQKYVTQEALDHLNKIKQKIDEYQLEVDRAAAQAVIDLINKLPSVKDVTLDNEKDVADVESKYNALTANQKALVSNYDKLKALREELTKLAAVKAEVDAFVEKVNALPSPDKLEPKHFDSVKQLYKEFTEMSDVHLKLLGKTDAPTKIVQLYSFMLKMLDGVVRNELYDFTLSGLVANPSTAKLEVSTPMTSDAELYAKYRDELQKASGKEIIAFYRMNLTGGKATQGSENSCDPWDTVQIRFPVPSVYSNHSEVGLVLFDPNKSGDERIKYVQPEIKDIGGKLYFVYNANTTQYVGVLAKTKSLSWIFSFFGKRSVVSLTPSMLDSSYTITEFKSNPLLDNG